MGTVTSGIPFRFANWYTLQVHRKSETDLFDIKPNIREVVLVSVVVSVTQPAPSPPHPSGRELSPPRMEVHVEFTHVRT